MFLTKYHILDPLLSKTNIEEIPTFSIFLGTIQRINPDHKLKKREISKLSIQHLKSRFK